MRPDSIAAILPILQPPPRLNIWQWAEASVDYSRVRNYDTEWRGPYSADYMPYWREPMESITDPSVRETWVLKCSRSGGSENVLLTPIRYVVACQPMPILYLSGQEGSTGKFMETRIKPGFGFADQTAAAYAVARKREFEVMFDAMDLIATWPANRMAFKQSGFPLILADEFSTWSEWAADMLRERMANYTFPHLVGISSPDPAQKRGSDQDPIFVEYGTTDRRKWHCVDPVTGNRFVFRMGDKDSADGLKWDRAAKRDDGTWDLNAVADSAHYITPDGTRIDDAARMDVVRTGQWTATNPDGIRNRRGYHVNRFMVPFKSGSFGHIAAAFVAASRKGPIALRTFVYEYLAEQWYGEKVVTEDKALDDRRGQYGKGQRIATVTGYSEIYRGKRTMPLVTVDVQKRSLFWVAREWVDGGDSGLIDWGELVRWEDIKERAVRYGARKVFIDNSYPERAFEVAQQCKAGVMRGGVPCYGRDQIKRGVTSLVPFHIHANRDPFEGTEQAGRIKLTTITHHPNTLKTMLWGLINATDGHHWHLYRDIDDLYRRHMMAEECVDGAWIKRDPQNHAWDCEVLQLMAAMVFGLFRQIDYAPALEQPDHPQQHAQPVNQSKPAIDPRVSYPQSQAEDDEDED